MRLALMQPYFFPYIGYFQLMAAADLFVVFDDVQYIKRGWVNRNRILVNASPQWITMPVVAASHRLTIVERYYTSPKRSAAELAARISSAYKHAPFLRETMALIEECLAFDDPNVAKFNTNLLTCVARRMSIRTPFKCSSEIAKDSAVVGAESRVIDMCARLGATTYINLIGGRALYTSARFAEHGIDLRFLHSDAKPYPQRGGEFVPSLSVIDVLMFNDDAEIQRMLPQCSLLR